MSRTEQVMRISRIVIILLCFSVIGCRTKIVCGFGDWNYEGEGLESKLVRFETKGKIDSISTLMNIKTTYVREKESGKEEKEAIGVSILVKESGSDKMEVGGVTNMDGTCEISITPGKYDIEISYTGFNYLILQNVKIATGEIIEAEIRLGERGEELKKYEVNLADEY